jgi:ATP-binding protein involved in chromosome partitioning
LRTPAVTERSATIRPTPIATPAAVSAVRTGRRSRFFQTSSAHVIASILASLRPMPSRDEILEALGRVIDPELRRPVTELDMVRDVAIDGGDVSVTIALTVAGCPLRSSFQDQVHREVGSVAGVASVRLGFDVMSPDEKAALTAKLRGGVTERTQGIALDRDTRVLAVASGKGGVGKSSLTVNLAAAFQGLGRSVGILDADVYGHSIPHMLGVAQRPVVVDKMIVPPVRDGLKLMSIGFFLDDNSPIMWRGPMLHRALEQFLQDVHWGALDMLLVDMPPGTGDVSISLGQLLPRAEAVVVTTPQPAAQQVAVRAGLMAQKTNMRLLGAVENMTGEIFGAGGGDALARELGVPLLGRVPLDPLLRECADEGRPLVTAHPESEAARAVVALAERIDSTARERGIGITKSLPLVS